MMHRSKWDIAIEEYKQTYFLKAERLPFFNFEAIESLVLQETVIGPEK